MHGVFPLVYHTLKEYSFIIPEDVVLKMKYINLNIAKQNMLMTSELIKIMKLLEENNVEAISFKGPTLSQMAYGDITLRQYSDLDILVKSKNVKEAFEILKKNNYISKYSSELLDNKYLFDVSKDIILYNEKATVELHWKLFEKRFFSFSNNFNEQIFEHTSFISINNSNIRVLSIEFFVFYLIIHGSKHYWERIEWLNDIHRILLQNTNLDYKKLFNYSLKLNARKMTATSLLMLEKFYNFEFENEVKLFMKEYSSKNIILDVVDLWNKSTTEKKDNTINIDEITFILKYQDNYSMKIKVLIKLLFQVKVDDIKMNNFKYIFMYYLTRPIRILKRFILR